MTVFNKEPFVETFEDKIEAADHFGGKVDKLIVELSVMLLQMRSLDLENVLL